MKSLDTIFMAGCIFLAVVQPAMSTVASSEKGKPPNVVTNSTVVQRGGTVNAINLQKNSITVDGVVFALTAAPVVVHAPSNEVKSKTKNFQLTPGMQIVFETSKNNYSAQVQIREIWVVSLGKDAVK